MALTGDQVDAITRSTVDLYRTAEWQILQLVTRHLRQGIDGPTWAQDRLTALAALRRAVEDIVRQLGEDNAEHVVRALNEAYRSGSAAALTGLPEDVVTRLNAARAATVVTRAAVIENLAAALVQDIGKRHSNVLRHILDVYRTVIQQATAVSVAGGQTRRQASQFAYQRFIDQGIASFTDSRGRRWRLSSYVEMGVRTVTQRAAVQGQTDRLQSLGLDLVIVSDSPRECERCRPWEGKVLAISGARRGRVELPSMVGSGTVTVDIAGTVDEARADGLMHPNCTHSLRAYLPGATRRPPRPTANPKGYEAKERQRAIERQIRRWKEREAGALDDTGKATAAAKVRQWQGEMRKHLAANRELKRLPYREQIGAGGPTRIARPIEHPSPHPGIDKLPRIVRPDHLDPADETDRELILNRDARETNPGYGQPGYDINCVHVVATHELRRRGYDVTASPLPEPLRPNRGRKHVEAIHRWRTPDGKLREPKYLSAAGAVIKELESWPDGARGWVRIGWAKKYGGGGHIFNVEKINGEVRYLDAQNSRAMLDFKRDYASRATRGPYAFDVTRVDDLTPTDDVLEFVKER